MRHLILLAIACVLITACATKSTIQPPKITSPEENRAIEALKIIDAALSKQNAFKMVSEGPMLSDMSGTNTFNWNGQNISQAEAMSKLTMWKEWIPKLEVERTKLLSVLDLYRKDTINEQKKIELQKTVLEVNRGAIGDVHESMN
jgi:hypothetical protein